MDPEEAAILLDRERVLGLEAGRYYHHLWRQLVLMHETLHELRVILNIRQGTVSVPSPLRKRHFSMVWGAYGRDLVHSISALADPAKDRRFNNASLDGLMSILEQRGLVSSEFKQALVEFKEAAAPVTVYRNKHLAHFDADTILAGTASSVSTTLNEIDACLTKAAAVMNVVEREYFQNSVVMYNYTWVPPGGIETLVAMLRKGDEAR